MNTVFFTGNGDGGESVVGEKKVEKDHPVLGFLGSLDELNSVIGWCRSAADVPEGSKDELLCKATLLRIQELLFILQAEIAGALFGYAASKKITSTHIAYIEGNIKKIDETIPAIKNFIVPGGCELSTRIDIARAISRRVERDAVIMRKTFEVSPEVMAFLNRISSILFALARYANYVQGIREEHPRYE